MNNKITTIRVSESLKKRLATLGRKEDTYEDIIIRLMNNFKKGSGNPGQSNMNQESPGMESPTIEKGVKP